MTALRIRPRAPLGERLDLGPLNPDRFAELPWSKLETIELRRGRQKLPLRELFEIELAPSEQPQLEITPAGERLDRIGEGLTGGRIEVRGDAGAYLGRNMKGGTIHVHGRCGALAATGLSGGRIVIDGDCGDHLGAAEPGLRHGMRGGLVVVRGNAGDRAADRLRRGLIFIEGDAGAYCGARMTAGSVAVLGKLGPGAGFGMRRGTLFLAHTPAGLPATFNDAGQTQLVFLQLWGRALRGLPEVADGFRPAGDWARRWVGDLAVGGQGEVLQLLPR